MPGIFVATGERLLCDAGSSPMAQSSLSSAICPSRRELDEAVASDPRSAEARFRRAVLYMLADKRFDDADRELERALALRPAEPAYLYARVISYELRAIVCAR